MGTGHEFALGKDHVTQGVCGARNPRRPRHAIGRCQDRAAVANRDPQPGAIGDRVDGVARARCALGPDRDIGRRGNPAPRQKHRVGRRLGAIVELDPQMIGKAPQRGLAEAVALDHRVVGAQIDRRAVDKDPLQPRQRHARQIDHRRIVDVVRPVFQGRGHQIAAGGVAARDHPVRVQPARQRDRGADARIALVGGRPPRRAFLQRRADGVQRQTAHDADGECRKPARRQRALDRGKGRRHDARMGHRRPADQADRRQNDDPDHTRNALSTAVSGASASPDRPTP